MEQISPAEQAMAVQGQARPAGGWRGQKRRVVVVPVREYRRQMQEVERPNLMGVEEMLKHLARMYLGSSLETAQQVARVVRVKGGWWEEGPAATLPPLEALLLQPRLEQSLRTRTARRERARWDLRIGQSVHVSPRRKGPISAP
jgi:hypothetical protein